MTHVVCVGDVMVDVVARLPGPLATGSDTPAPIDVTGGGAAANVAAWLASAGADATFVGRVGDDALGAAAVDALTAAGVTVLAPRDTSRPTGTCIVLVDPTGERTMVPSAGANAVGGDVTSLPGRADWLYLSGYALFRASSQGLAAAVLRHARDRHWSIAVDAASAAPLADLGADRFGELVGDDVLLFANTDEAAVLTGLDEPAAAAQLLAHRFGRAVVKRGAAGAVWSDGSGVRSVAAEPALVLDSTGAGDAFAAGFLACADDESGRLRAAVRSAARAVELIGGRPDAAGR